MDQAVMEQRRVRREAGAVPTAGRTDGLLRLRIQQALGEAGYHPLRELAVAVDGDEVVLSGHLPTYHLAQLALTKAMRVDGVARVRNEIQVN
jgi:osmotically-inducible protein OsmY